jgi:hypothetical protein
MFVLNRNETKESKMTTDEWGMQDGFEPSEFNDAQTEEFGTYDASDVDASEVGSGELPVDKPGMYHFLIEATARPSTHYKDDMNKSRKPDVLCICTVLHSVLGQSPEGSVYYHSVILGGYGGGEYKRTDRDKMCNFMVGLGILKKQGDKIIDPETGSTKLNFATFAKRLNNVQFVGKITFNAGGAKFTLNESGEQVPDGKYQDKYELSWGKGAFPVGDARVKNVPKNEDMLRAGGYLPPAGSAGHATHAGATTVVSAAPAAAAAANHAANPAMAPDL